MARDAVLCHFEEDNVPRVIRLHLVREEAIAVTMGGDGSRLVETPRERRRRIMDEVFEDIRTTRSGFSSFDNVPRENLYERPVRPMMYCIRAERTP